MHKQVEQVGGGRSWGGGGITGIDDNQVTFVTGGQHTLLYPTPPLPKQTKLCVHKRGSACIVTTQFASTIQGRDVNEYIRSCSHTYRHSRLDTEWFRYLTEYSLIEIDNWDNPLNVR